MNMLLTPVLIGVCCPVVTVAKEVGLDVLVRGEAGLQAPEVGGGAKVHHTPEYTLTLYLQICLEYFFACLHVKKSFQIPNTYWSCKTQIFCENTFFRVIKTLLA